MRETSSSADGLEQLINLEGKINQTVDLLKSARAEKEELARENARLRSALEGLNKAIQILQKRLGHLERERETVRSRVQRLLRRVDSLTSDQSKA